MPRPKYLGQKRMHFQSSAVASATNVYRQITLSSNFFLFSLSFPFLFFIPSYRLLLFFFLFSLNIPFLLFYFSLFCSLQIFLSLHFFFSTLHLIFLFHSQLFFFLFFSHFHLSFEGLKISPSMYRHSKQTVFIYGG